MGKNNYNHLMLDIETLSTDAFSAPIVQIGAVVFRVNKPFEEAIIDKFLVNITPESNYNLGLKPSERVLEWWKGEKITWQANPEPVSLSDALLSFNNWLAPYKPKYLKVWSHVTFDITILQNAYRLLGLKFPFHFSNILDLRSFLFIVRKGLGLERYNPESKHTHNALEDCLNQVEYFLHYWSEIRKQEV